MKLVLFQPEIPQNAGTILRLAACLRVPVEVIEPLGFIWSEKRMRRAGMDYLEFANVRRHANWQAFQEDRAPGRLVLLTTKGDTRLPDARFEADDHLLFGQESAGAPDFVHEAAALRVRVPMVPQARSINLAVCAGLVLGEALRQVDGWPG